MSEYTPEAFFTFKDVGVVFPPGKVVLKNINFQIPLGKKLVVLGESGSGKSTLARILKGLIKASSGEVSVEGLNPCVEEERRKIIERVGLIFSNPSQQIFAPRVEDDILFGLENRGVSSKLAEEMLNNVLSLLHINHLRKEMTYNLSMGEQLLVVTAGVLAMQPEALILDEPRAFIGPLEFERFFSSIMANTAKRTLVWITHHPEDALWADLLLVLSAGEVAFFGSPKVFFADAVKENKYSFLVPDILHFAELLKKRGVSFDEIPVSIDEVFDKCY